MFHQFDLKVVLNHPLAAERWRLTGSELQRVGIKDYTRFEAVAAPSPMESFNRSVAGALRYFVMSGKNCMLFLEDDVVFKRNTGLLQAVWAKAWDELPLDWDVLYLGANVHVGGFQPPVRYSQHLCRLSNAWTTHAVAFTRGCAKYLLNDQPPTSDGMFDGWLSDKLKGLKAFCVTPMLAYQRPGKSLIWGGEVNYDPVFIESNNILVNSKL